MTVGRDMDDDDDDDGCVVETVAGSAEAASVVEGSTVVDARVENKPMVGVQ